MGPDVYFSGERWEFTQRVYRCDKYEWGLCSGRGVRQQPATVQSEKRTLDINYPAMWDGRQKGGMFSKLTDVPDVVWRARKISLKNGYWG